MRQNILGYLGYLTDEDRKKPLEHTCDWLTFTTCLDLSKPIKVEALGITTKVPLNKYSQDIASFIVWWSHFVLPGLNGFSGMSHLKFELVNFEIV